MTCRFFLFSSGLFWVSLLLSTCLHAAPKARIAVLKDETLPTRNSAPSSPDHFASLLQSAGHEVRFIRAADLADPKVMTVENIGLVILPHGSAFPYEAIEPMKAYLKAGGSFFSTGGYAFDDLYHLKGPEAAQGFREGFENGQMDHWAPRSQEAGVSFERVSDVKRNGEHAYRITVSDEAKKNWYILSRRFAFAKPGESVMGKAHIKTENVRDGFAYIGFCFFDKDGKRISFTQSSTDLTGTNDWTERTCVGEIPKGTAYAMFNCILYGYGKAWFDDVDVTVIDNRMLNTRYGYSAGAGILHTREDQVGVFDASYPLARVDHAQTSKGQHIVADEVRLTGDLRGWSAAAMICSKTWANEASRRWIPLLDAFDGYDRLRGSIGAIVFNYGPPFRGSAWAFFGVNSKDIFAPTDEAMGKLFLAVIDRMLTRAFLHDLTSNYYCYRQGEPVTMTVNVSNLGKAAQDIELTIEIIETEGRPPIFTMAETVHAEAGSTQAVEFAWKPEAFKTDLYRYRVTLTCGEKVIDAMTNAFVVWNDAVVARGPKLGYADNYVTIDGRPTLLCGSNHYAVLFRSLDQNPERWEKDFALMRDNGMNVLRILHLTGEAGEKKPGFAMQDISNPPEWLLRRFDALVQLSQKHQVILFLSAHDHIKVELNDADLAAEQRWCEMLARRYAAVPGLMWDIQNEPFLFHPHTTKDPDAVALFNRYLKTRYESTEALRAAWGQVDPQIELGKVPLPGDKMWHLAWDDKSALDFERARVWALERWINANAEALRKGAKKPITVGYLPTETAAERWLGNDALDFANLHAYVEPDDLAKRLRFIDQRSLGRSLSVGEFGVNFHPGMYRTNGYKKAPWIVEPDEANRLFMQMAHETFGLGGSSVCNWLWSDSAELVFSMGLIHAHRHVQRDLLSVYRNCAFFFRLVQPKYDQPEIYFVIADSHRLGGQSKRVTEAIINGIDMLVKCHVEFAAINESGLDRLPDSARVLVYPIPFCPSDDTYDHLCDFVRRGGVVYLSGDISYDPHRDRTRTRRLEELCGVRFVRENYPNVMVEKATAVDVAEVERRPCIEVDPIAAERVPELDGVHPLAVVNQFGQGKVYFSTDPIELYAEPTETARYRHFLRFAGVERIAMTPDKPTLHVHRQATPGGGRLYVVFNGEDDAYERVTLSDVEPGISLDVPPRLPGAVVLDAKGQVLAVETHGDVMQGDTRLVEGNIHVMIAALDGMPIVKSSALLVMPFHSGEIKVLSEVLSRGAAAEAGEMQDGKWRWLDHGPCKMDGRYVRVTVPKEQTRHLILIAAEEELPRAIRSLEKLLQLESGGVQQ
ncbi:MAG: beta-galactosidase [Planctomycetota bacterium]